MKKFYEICVIINLSLIMGLTMLLPLVENTAPFIITIIILGYFANLNRKRIEKD